MVKTKEEILKELVEMTRYLGVPRKGYVILGEGNTSARISPETFWVKASGSMFHNIDEQGFLEIDSGKVLSDLEVSEMSDAEIKASLIRSKVNSGQDRIPSLETYLHALAYTMDSINFVGHTHPTAVTAVLCSKKAEEAIQGRLFPDEIVYCGPEPAFVPYTDPGLPLAKAVETSLNKYTEKWGGPPKVLLIKNHGMIALGESAEDVEKITDMYEKTAQILLGAYALGGPDFLKPEEVERIYTRPDERYRRTFRT